MLEYLSDDEIYGRAERRAARKARRAQRKRQRKQRRRDTPRGRQRRQKRRGQRRSRRETFRAKVGRKPSRGARRRAEGRPSRIARIALAPARGAFLTAVRLNVGKLATKLVRVYSKPGGKKKLMEFWRKFGGKWKGLRKRINKGAKASISNDELGAIGVAAIAAIAAPIMIAVAAIIKSFKAGGGKREKQEFDDVIELGKEELATNPEYDNMTTAFMDGEEVAVMQRPEDYEGLDDEEEEEEFGPAFSFVSLSGFLFKTVFMLCFITFENPVMIVLATIVSSYCLLGVFLLPFQIAGKQWVEWYYKPINNFIHALSKTIQNVRK